MYQFIFTYQIYQWIVLIYPDRFACSFAMYADVDEIDMLMGNFIAPGEMWFFPL